MGVIHESQNEYYDEILKKEKKNTCVSFSNDEVHELLLAAVKNNNLQQFRELVEMNDVNIDLTGHSGWNALHLACFYGTTEIAYEIVNKLKADVNALNSEDWSPLHLASYKGQSEIVKILLSNTETDININTYAIGTPLHCACKKNNLQVVSLLLHKADFK